jgi:hypothetical protein
VGSALGYTDLAGAPKRTFVASGGGNNGHVGQIDGVDAYVSIGAAPGYPFRVATNGAFVVALDSDVNVGGLYYGTADKAGSLARIAPQVGPGDTTNRNWGRLVTNGTHAFAADYGTIHVCPLPSCTGGWSVGAGNTPLIFGVNGLAASATDLYWTVETPPVLSTCAIAVGTAGCGRGAPIATKLAAGVVPRDIVLHDGRLYVAAGESLSSCIPTMCNQTWVTHADGFLVRGRPAVDAEAIYWIMYDSPPPADASTGSDAGVTPKPAPANVRLMKLAK